MALRICQQCDKEKSPMHYIAVNSKMFKNGVLPICRSCLNEKVLSTPKEQVWNVADKIMQFADIPFIPEKWQEIFEGNKTDPVGTYISIFRQEKYSNLDWNEYNKAYLELGDLSNAVPKLRDKKINELRLKWGRQYDIDGLVYLENLHNGLIRSQNIVGAINEDQALKICKISYVIEEKIRNGEDFTRDLKVYDDLVRLANFTPKQVKDADEFESAGELFSYLEKTGWKPNYDNDTPRDEIDFSMKNFQNWVRKLYCTETGIAEEIKERVDALETYARLNDIKFDRKEFENFIDDIAEEEFNPDL